MQVSVVSFMRTEKGPREHGVAVSKKDNTAGEVDVIIDANGQPVQEIWKYQAMNHAGCFSFNPNHL